MVVKRVSPLSAGKVAGALYAIMGLVLGGFISLFAVAGSALAPAESEAGFAGVLFGVGAIIVLPIFYGVLGFLMTMLMAVLYNVVASAIGGIEVDLQ